MHLAEPGLNLSARPSRSPQERPKISSIGTRALLLEAPGDFELAQQKRIWSLAEETATWPDVEEVVLGVTNLMLVFKNPPRDLDVAKAALVEAWRRLPEKDVSGKVIEIPVTYGGELGIDVLAVSAYSGLSAEEIIHIHAAGTYTVCAIGSSPGFGYLHGLDPRLFMPRKTVPSLRMLKGSVTIGGIQTGISVSTGPNGWNAIGWASASMFDPTHMPPALLAPGDQIKFLIERIEL